MQKLRADGYEPDGMILKEDEVRYILREYFDVEDNEELPENLEIMGLPVKVKE